MHITWLSGFLYPKINSFNESCTFGAISVFYGHWLIIHYVINFTCNIYVLLKLLVAILYIGSLEADTERKICEI